MTCTCLGGGQAGRGVINGSLWVSGRVVHEIVRNGEIKPLDTYSIRYLAQNVDGDCMVQERAADGTEPLSSCLFL